MLEITLNCKPDPQTLTQLVQVAILEQKSLESLLHEAIAQYLQANLAPNTLSASPPPLTRSWIGYMMGVQNSAPKLKQSSPQKFNLL